MRLIILGRLEVQELAQKFPGLIMGQGAPVRHFYVHFNANKTEMLDKPPNFLFCVIIRHFLTL